MALVEGDDLVIKAAIGPFAVAALGQRLPRSQGRTWQVVETGQTFLSNDLLAEGVRPTTPMRSYLAAPLIRRGWSYGVLEIDSTEPGAFSAPDRDLLERVAVTLSGPIELAHRLAQETRALAEVEAARSRLSFLADASRLLVASLESPLLLDSLARLIVPYLADWCRIDTIDPDGSIRRQVVAPDPAEGAPAEAPEVPAIDPAGSDALARVLRSGRAEWWPGDETAAGEARPGLGDPAAIGGEPAAWLCVPLAARGHVLGAITLVLTHSGRRYGPADLALAEDLAGRCALALDNARLYQEAQTAVQLRNEFLSSVSHDLKCPLTAIKGQTQMLQRQ
ncbi:MAG TPA: GAF domain-containing protein, partial [Dehalococcoidia bacterium]|nr:GAF domain-containing protein [Dehalococcoidia bacterium]